MSTQPRTFVIVGASLAGAKAAETLREEGFDGRLILIGDESERPYERPPLTKDYLRAESPREQGYVHSDGRTIECDFAVVAIGVVPRVQLAETAGLKIDNGIVVDASLATSVAGVYAAGDVANAWHPCYERQLRVEHWANALNQGPAAARAMLGQDVAYDRIPYFFSDQYDVGMEYSGYAAEWDGVVFRGDPATRKFVAFWLHDQRVVAGMNVNVWDVNEHVQALIRSRQPIDATALADPDTPLDSLIPRSSPHAD